VEGNPGPNGELIVLFPKGFDEAMVGDFMAEPAPNRDLISHLPRNYNRLWLVSYFEPPRWKSGGVLVSERVASTLAPLFHLADEREFQRVKVVLLEKNQESNLHVRARGAKPPRGS
jgi:hypothetical protein